MSLFLGCPEWVKFPTVCGFEFPESFVEHSTNPFGNLQKIKPHFS